MIKVTFQFRREKTDYSTNGVRQLVRCLVGGEEGELNWSLMLQLFILT